MNDFKKQLSDLQDKINDRKVQKAKLEEREKSLTEELEKINLKLKELGIENEEALKKEISELEEQIEIGINKCQKLLA